MGKGDIWGSDPDRCQKCNSGAIKYDEHEVGRCNVCGNTVYKSIKVAEPATRSFTEASKNIESMIKMANLRREVDRLQGLEEAREQAQAQPQAQPQVQEQGAEQPTASAETITGTQNWRDMKRSMTETTKANSWFSDTALKLIGGIEDRGIELALTRELLEDSKSLVKRSNLGTILGDGSTPLLPLVLAFIYASGKGIEEYAGLKQRLLAYGGTNEQELDMLGDAIEMNMRPGEGIGNRKGILNLIDEVFGNSNLQDWRREARMLVVRLDLRDVDDRLGLRDRQAFATGALCESIGGKLADKLDTISKQTGVPKEDVLRGADFVRKNSRRRSMVRM